MIPSLTMIPERMLKEQPELAAGLGRLNSSTQCVICRADTDNFVPTVVLGVYVSLSVCCQPHADELTKKIRTAETTDRAQTESSLTALFIELSSAVKGSLKQYAGPAIDNEVSIEEASVNIDDRFLTDSPNPRKRVN
jgi:hypothetical protein